MTAFLERGTWFPAGVFHDDRQLDDDFAESYASFLERAGGQPLSRESRETEIYRLLLGESYGNYELTLTFRRSTAGTLVQWSRFCRCGGSATGERPVDAEAAAHLISQLERSRFWSCGNAVERRRGGTFSIVTDGTWMVEGRRGDDYQFIEAYHTDTNWHAVNQAFLEVAGIDGLEAEIHRCDGRCADKG